MRFFTKIAVDEAVQHFKESKSGLLYIAPTGSGKTRKALKVTRGTPTTVVGTASLQNNFNSEAMKAFHKILPGRTTTTYAMVSRGNPTKGGKNIVLDESQYIRNPKTKAYRYLKGERSKYNKALLLTATPMYNEPADLSSQVNFVANKTVLPENKKEFYNKYFVNKLEGPGFWGRILGIKPGVVRELDKPKKLKKAVKDYVYVEDKAKYKDLMPGKSEEVVSVPLSKQQLNIYKFLNKKAPFYIRYKIKHGLPPSKSEAKNLNAYLSGTRQVSNTAAPFVKGSPEDISPKFKTILKDIKSELARGGKILTYSNFVGAGVERLSQLLKAQKIPHSYLVGSLSKKERQAQVDAYNKGKTNVFLYSGAGAEGLNLPKTTLVQLVEPHWNKTRLSQAESRGIRRGDDPNRIVHVREYVSVFPTKTDKKTTGQYLEGMSARKDKEISQILKALKS